MRNLVGNLFSSEDRGRGGAIGVAAQDAGSGFGGVRAFLGVVGREGSGRASVPYGYLSLKWWNVVPPPTGLGAQVGDEEPPPATVSPAGVIAESYIGEARTSRVAVKSR